MVVWSRICIAETVEMILVDRAVEREHELARSVKRAVDELNIAIYEATKLGMDVKLQENELYSAGSLPRPVLSVFVRGSII